MPLRRFLYSFLLSFLAAIVFAQATTPSLITQAVDDANLAVLKGNTHPMALPRYDQGAVPGAMMLNRMLLVLKRSPAQDAALDQLMQDQQDKSSPNYHKWLTPDEFGQQFGPSDKDIQTITTWLKSHGFAIAQISRGRSVIEFSGTVAQVQEAFHTSIHNYVVNGQSRLANANDPKIPAAFVPVLAGPLSLNSFPKKSMSHFVGAYSKMSGKLDRANPQFTFPGGCDLDNNCYAVVPYDFATIYNVLPLWTSGIDGTGETIAIVGRTNINIQDVRDFRSLFGLPAKDPQIILNGPDPGINSDESEADIDVQWSGAVAKNATIDFVTSASTETTDGVDLSAEYVIDNNLAPVMSESYGLCELGLGTAGNSFFNALWAQAAAQGITVMVSTGDNGSAGCDFNQGFAPQPAQYGLAVSGIASTPYNVAVGGTDFQDAFNPTTYWSTSNDPTTQESALGYIPESTWNSTCTNGLFAQVGFSTNAETNCNNGQLLGFVTTVGASGGASNCTTNSQQLGSCSGGYAKPSWQTGTGVPADGKRDIPDVSLFASSGFVGNFYVICQSDLVGPCSLATFGAFGGTSVASPAFAGIMALVNQQTGARQGNANFVLYKLAAQQPTAFHDVTAGTIAMPCQASSPNCTIKTAGHNYGVLSGFATTSGYDLATGLGSVNAANLVNQWSSITFKPSTTTLSLTPTSITHGALVSVSGTVAPSSGSGTPTGNVSLLTSTGKSVQDFALIGGLISGTTQMLPGGTYTVTAHYGGDPTYGGSDSTPPISVTVSKEGSKVVPRMITFDTTGNILNQNATTAVYGSPYILRMDASNAAGNVCGPLLGCPTGSLALTDNGLPLDGGTFVLNNLGYAEDDVVQLSGGSHTIQAVYAGDNSFTGSTGTDAVTITPATMTYTTFSASPNPINVGAALGVYTHLQARSSGAAPAGTFTFTLDGAPLSGTLTINSSTGGQYTGFADIDSTFTTTISTPGSHTIVETYSGDPNYASISNSTNISARYPTTITITANPANPQPNATVVLTTLVDTNVNNLAPTGRMSFMDALTQAPLPGNVTLTPTTDGSGHSALQGQLTLVPAHNNLAAYAIYNGDQNYSGGLSNNTSVAVAGNDFALFPSASTVNVPRGSGGTLIINLDGQSGYAGTASFACSGLPAESSCDFSPSTVTGTGQTVVTLFTTLPHSNAKIASRTKLGLWASGVGLLLGAIFLIGPSRRRGRSSFLTTVVLLLLSLGCGGGGGSGGGGGGGGPTDPGTPRGSYTVTATGTDGTLTHTTSFTLTVQ